MDTLDAMRLFVRIVERRSFTLAAQDFGLPRSTATSAIQRMEERLGVRLLQRTTRHVSPTLDGEAYYRRCLGVLAEVEDMEAAFTGTQPKGKLRVDVPGTLARHFMLPGLPRFLEQYPELELHIGAGDRLVDLVREGVDCVLRVGNPGDDSMVGRRIASLAIGTFASPQYLDRYGDPKTPEELAGHRMVGFVSSATGAVAPLEFGAGGRTIKEVTLPAPVTVSDAELYVASARLGFGLVQVPRYHAMADVAAGRLVEVLGGHLPPPWPVYVLYPPSRQLSLRVRVFIDWLAAEFERHIFAE